MDRRVTWLCLVAGSTAGGLLPEAWGAGAFGVASLLGSVVGAIAGIWAAARISQAL
jgi:outer membrane lipoprotein SlyB